MTINTILDQPEVTALLFPSTGNNKTCPCPEGAEDIIFKVSTGIDISCRFHQKSQDSPVIIFFPATDDHEQELDQMAQHYLDHGMSFFLASYPGCGGNNGEPTVSALLESSGEVFQLILKCLSEKGCSGSVFVMGQGFGSVIAVDRVVNNKDQVKGMILESVVSTTSGFMKALGLEQIEIEESTGFNVIEKIEKIKNPTLIFHGAMDDLVKIRDAENLQAFSGARTKQFFVIPGAKRHRVSQTGGELYFQSIKKFIDTVCGVNTWRHQRKKLKRNR